MSRFFSILLVVSFHFSLAWAQVNTGTILGTVSDSTAAVLPGVEVVVTHVDTARSRTIISDDSGRYQATNLNLGFYEVIASLPGFQTAVRAGIEITIDRRAVVDFTLNVGEISERVTVTGEASLVETTSGSLGQIVDRQSVIELPLNGRDLTDLLTLQAGTTLVTTGSTGGNSGFSQRVSIAGARPQDAAVLLDGTATKSTDQGVPSGVSGNFLGAEGIQEFKVERNSYSAQYGGASGGVINVVSKSGTNEFHGSVYDFHRNDNLDAANFFTNRDGLEKPPLIRNQFGFSIGGPVIKNRTFFFFNYEGMRERKSVSSTRLLPNPATKLGMLPTGPGGALEPVPGLVPEILPYWAFWPDPGSSAVDLGDGTSREGINISQPINEDYFQIRGDHNFSDADSIFARYTWQNSEQSRNRVIDRWSALDTVKNRFLTVEHKHIFSPTALNTFRFGYGHREGAQAAFEDCPTCDPALRFVPDSAWQAPLGADPVQGFTSVGGLSSVGIGAQSDGAGWFLSETDNYNYMDDVILNRGAHSIKLGFSWWNIKTGGQNPSRPAGWFNFEDAAGFMQEDPQQFRGGILPDIDFKRRLNINIIGWYIQDDWQVSPNLTLNLGLRHEFYTVPTEEDGKLSNLKSPLTDSEVTVLGTRGDSWFENPSLASFMPRIGIAYDPTGSGKTAIRMGAGLFYNHIQPDIFRRAIFRSTPFMKETNIRGGTIPYIGIYDAVVNGGLGAEDMQPFAYDYMKNPKMLQWNLNVQQEILPGTAVTAGYTGSRGIHLMHQTCVNSGYAEDVNGRLVYPSNASRANQNPLFSDLCLLSQESAANSFYHGLELGLQRRFADGFQLQVSYGFSRAISESDQVNGLYGNNGNGVAYYAQPKLYRSLAAYHVANNFTTSFVWQLPFASNMSGGARYILDGWQVGGIIRLADGPAIMVTKSAPSAIRNLGYNGRSMPPDLGPGGNNSPVLGGPDEYFDTSYERDPALCSSSGAAFCAPPSSRTLGNVGRNTLIAPGLNNVDFSLTKNTPIGEYVNLQFRAEFFNLFNRANFSTPNTRIDQGSGGRIDRTTLTERQIQLGLRLTF
jgi:hypothetical protein